MKTQKIFQSPVAKQMYDLKVKSAIAIVNGKCKVARKTQKEYAKLAVNNFSTAVNLPNPIGVSYPLFSKAGLNTLKYFIYRAFTKTTPEEQLLKTKVQEYRDSLLFDIRQ